MTRRQSLARVLRLYRDAPGSPARPTRSDWAIAGDLYRRGVRLEHLAHAIRLATLRRRFKASPRQDRVHSLAYYRAVLLALTDDQLDSPYVDYVRQRHQELLPAHPRSTEPRPERQNPALSRRR